MFAIFMAMKDNPVVNLIFESSEQIVETFYLGQFRFILYDVQGLDVCLYYVKSRLLEFEIAFVGIDSEILCGSESNFDFVHFVWQFFSHFIFQNHALTLLPDLSSGAPRLLCLRYYRAMIEGWTFSSECLPCEDDHRTVIRPLPVA
jgi:hypothetical protein